jgi:hypothetical protein
MRRNACGFLCEVVILNEKQKNPTFHKVLQCLCAAVGASQEFAPPHGILNEKIEIEQRWKYSKHEYKKLNIIRKMLSILNILGTSVKLVLNDLNVSLLSTVRKSPEGISS